MINQDQDSKSVFYFSRPSPFPQLYYVSYIGIIVAAVQFFTGHNSQGIFILVVSFFILLLRAWSKLNIQSGSLVDFFAIIPYRTVKFNRINRVILSAGTVSRVLNSRGNTSTVEFTQYQIALDVGNDKLTLREGRNKNSLLKKATQIALAANVELEDRTS